jgi:hypothetical protein
LKTTRFASIDVVLVSYQQTLMLADVIGYNRDTRRLALVKASIRRG